MLRLNLHTPHEIHIILSQRVKRLRLINEWTQVELAERAGITLASLKRFESTGKISLERLLQIALALGRLTEFMQLF
jgi:transcriptional regulator with XRE-family HTH domain